MHQNSVLARQRQPTPRPPLEQPRTLVAAIGARARDADCRPWAALTRIGWQIT